MAAVTSASVPRAAKKWPFSDSTPAAPPRIPTDKVVPVDFFDDSPSNRTVVARLLLRYDEALDPDKLRDSLFRLLNRPDWRRIGARLRLTANGKLERHIPSHFDEDRMPFVWSSENHDISFAEYPMASRIPQPTTEPSVLGNPEDIVQLMHGSGPSTRFSECVSQDIPQLTVHVECFRDATLVSLSWLHTLTDAMGMSFVLQAWQLVLEGRDDEVQPLNGAETDLLDNAGRIPIERHRLSNSLMKPWQLVLYALNLLVSRLWWGSNETRVTYIPGKWLRDVRSQAIEELKTDSTNRNMTFLSDNDIICSLMSKVISGGPNNTRPVWTMQAANLRPRLQSVTFPANVASVGNYTNVIITGMAAGAVQTGSISQTAATFRRNTDAHNSGDQMDAMMSMFRQYLSSGRPAVPGVWNMQLCLFSNWSKVRTYDLDFSAARMNWHKGQLSTPLRPSLALPVLSNAESFLAMPMFGVNGPDEMGGYWVTGSISKSRWDAARAELASLGEAM